MGSRISPTWVNFKNKTNKSRPQGHDTGPRRFGKRILKTQIIDGREYYLHATKGWRSRRA